MRKSSSFMCVLVVLLAGGAEAQRPMPVDALFGLMAMGFASVDAWDSCQRFDQIYANGEELCNVMWNDSFEYTTDEANAYTFWWFEGGQPGAADPVPNPNNEIATLLGLTPPVLNDQCQLAYYHKPTVSAEPASFTECHPWHSASCCSESTVPTPLSLNTGYGPGYRWDRCGPLSQACERFFVMEACFYECEPTAGLYRRYSDEQYAACNPNYSYGGNLGEGAVVTLGDGSSYTCTGSENQWQMYKMPIKASVCDSWFRACAEDMFCGGGDYFECARDFHEDNNYQDLVDAAHRNQTLLQQYATELEGEVDDLEDEVKKEKDSMPTWALGVIIAAAAVVLTLCICLTIIVMREKGGKPVFMQMDKDGKGPPATA